MQGKLNPLSKFMSLALQNSPARILSKNTWDGCSPSRSATGNLETIAESVQQFDPDGVEYIFNSPSPAIPPEYQHLLMRFPVGQILVAC